MEVPYIVIAGKKIEPAPPKMKVWRAFLKEADYNGYQNLDHILKI